MQFFRANGEPLVGGKLYTYTAGTTTPQPTYTDSAGGTANTNPVILDSRGEADIWLGGATYKFKLADANDVEIWTVDNISAPTSGVSPALSGNVTIDTNSSSPALKITQTGTGYALRVQDSADPDATATVIDNTGRLGVGTVSPSELVDISGGNLAFTAAGGTLYAKITPGALLTDIAADGAKALTFTTDSVERIRITDTGLVGIGKTPSAGVELDVVGDIAASVSVKTDTISELTSAAGVTIDGVLCKDSQVAPANRVITAATAVATTSGTNIDFTGIPSWVKRITVIFNGVSTGGTSDFIVQLGTASGVENTGYNSVVNSFNTSPGAATSTTAFNVYRSFSSNAMLVDGHVILTNISGNIWVASGALVNEQATISISGGRKTTAATLDRVRLTTSSGDTFDAGSVNIFYE
jgi:hypothetical protein